MRHYVKVANGVIVDGPREISSGGSESPNTGWSGEQMKLNGFFEVNLEYNPDTETVDYQNPTITADSVTYPRNSIDSTTALSICKTRLIKAARLEALRRIRDKYDIMEMMIVALGFQTNSGMGSDIQLVLDSFTNYRNAVNSSATISDAKSQTVNWPNL